MSVVAYGVPHLDARILDDLIDLLLADARGRFRQNTRRVSPLVLGLAEAIPGAAEGATEGAAEGAT